MSDKMVSISIEGPEGFKWQYRAQCESIAVTRVSPTETVITVIDKDVQYGVPWSNRLFEQLDRMK